MGLKERIIKRNLSGSIEKALIDVTESLVPYKVYTALLTQALTEAPVATILGNTLVSNPVWTRDAIGVYKSTGPFVLGKTFAVSSGVPNSLFIINTYVYDSDVWIEIVDRATGVFSDAVLDQTSIEIKVYE